MTAEQDGGPAVACRSCGSPAQPVLDLGTHPEANSFPRPGPEARDEPRWPLRTFVCGSCWLLQLDDAGPAEAASPGPPAYELSSTLRDHVDDLVDDALARAAAAAGSDRDLGVVELASHGGHVGQLLLARGIGSVAIEPDPALADAARRRGLEVVEGSLRRAAADVLSVRGPADLIVDNYLLSHVADPNEYMAAVAELLAPEGVAVIELDHVLPLVTDRRFDSIRHGHYSYLGLRSVSALAERHGLAVVDASPQPVYGGALRLVLRHEARGAPTPAVAAVLRAEGAAGLADRSAYAAFEAGVREVIEGLRAFLAARRAAGASVAAYGAPSRGNTLLNAVGATAADVAFTVDRSSLKQGRVLPGTHIPIHPPAHLVTARPAFVLILTWDIRDEVMAQLPEVASWGGRFVLPLPAFEIVDAAPPGARPPLSGR